MAEAFHGAAICGYDTGAVAINAAAVAAWVSQGTIKEFNAGYGILTKPPNPEVNLSPQLHGLNGALIAAMHDLEQVEAARQASAGGGRPEASAGHGQGLLRRLAASAARHQARRHVQRAACHSPCVFGPRSPLPRAPRRPWARSPATPAPPCSARCAS